MSTFERTVYKRHATEHPMAPQFKQQRYNQYQENHRHQDRRQPHWQHQRQHHHQRQAHHQHQSQRWSHNQNRQRFQAPRYQQAPVYREPLRELAPPTFEPKPEVAQPKSSMNDILAYIPFLRSLQSQGILPPTPVSAPPPPPKPLTEDDIWAPLSHHSTQKIRDQSKIDALLEKKPDQCSICCLKVVKGSEEFKEHMNYHFEVNMGDLLQRKPKYLKKEQPWYSGYLAGCKPAEEEKKEEELDVEAKGSGKCPVCHEKFTEYYDDDEEMWRYKGSVKKNGQIVHKCCADNCEDSIEPEVKPEPEIIYL